MIDDSKQEILNSISKNSCCNYAFISSIFLLSKISFNKNDLVLELDNFLHNKVKEVINKLYPTIKIEANEGELKLGGGEIKQLLIDCGLISSNIDLDIEVNGLNEELLMSDCCKITFLKALYLCSGNLYYNKNNFEKSNGYSIEFVFKNLALADDSKALMKYLGIKVGLTKRGNNVIMYIKNSEEIYNLFVRLNAVETSLAIQNNLVMREMRNDANRQGNCFDANLNKTLTASREQVKAIDYIIKNYGIDYLDESLQETALLRLANEDITLNEMQKLYSTKISRAGLKYKLDKIISIYKSLIE